MFFVDDLLLIMSRVPKRILVLYLEIALFVQRIIEQSAEEK